MKSNEVESAIHCLWNYHNLTHEVSHADLIFVPGHDDLRFADYAAHLYHKGIAPRILFSGYNYESIPDLPTEALLFSHRAQELGVPAEDILTEIRSTNTIENIANSRELLGESLIEIHSVLVLQRPYSSRRVYLTMLHNWPGAEIYMHTNSYTYSDYVAYWGDEKKIIRSLMGNLRRILFYPHLNSIAEEKVPEEAIDAYKLLKLYGYSDNFPRDITEKLQSQGIMTEL